MFTLIKDWLKIFGLALFLALFFKSCFFDVFTIPSTSMVNGLLPGDVVVVNKLRYGPKLFRSLLTIPFLHKYIPLTDGVKCYNEAIELPYLRFPGYAEIERNDLIVFHYPMDDLFPVDHRSFYIKRCLGLPGEVLEIKDDMVFIDGIKIKEPTTIAHRYQIKTKKEVENLMDSLNSFDGGKTIHATIWEISLDSSSAVDLSSKEYIESISKIKHPANEIDEYIFSAGENKWNLSNYGPIKIPAKGDTIFLTNENIDLYKRLINDYENHRLDISPEGEFFIDKIQSTYYIPEMNYYFGIGDNRHNSSDSRYWGFIPEDHIQGRASLILYSLSAGKNNSAFNLSRSFKKL